MAALMSSSLFARRAALGIIRRATTSPHLLYVPYARSALRQLQAHKQQPSTCQIASLSSSASTSEATSSVSNAADPHASSSDNSLVMDEVMSALKDGPAKLPQAMSFSRRNVGLRVDLKLDLPNTNRTKSRLFPYIWLRDNCRCSQCVDPDTLQRSQDTFSIPKTIEPKRGADGLVRTPDALQITWKDDAHTTYYPYEWLAEQLSPRKSLPQVHLWGSEIANHSPTIEYDEIMAGDEGVAKWTNQILSYGFSFVDGCPPTPERTEELLKRIAFIRETHYGGFYDFTADLSMKDTAYTTQRLRAHTDTTYFSDSVGFQMLHLLSHTEGAGGMSLLVDGFQAATVLLKENQRAFDALCDMPIPWHASGNEGIMITPSQPQPVLRLNERGALQQVRWNNDDRGPLPLHSEPMLPSIEDWYEAARLWNEILRRKELEYWDQLKPGRALIFDNWRVLHGRSEFTGKRRICGGYLNRDDFMSRWRTTNFKDLTRVKRLVVNRQ